MGKGAEGRTRLRDRHERFDFYTVITFLNFIKVVVSKIFTHLSFFLGILLKFVIPSSYSPCVCVCVIKLDWGSSSSRL